MEGFVGGACARDIVRTRALAVLQRGRPQLLSIRPGLETEPAAAGGDEIERLIVPMGCASEGAIDIYIEPHGALCRLVVIGFTPVAEAVARLAATLDYDVARFVLASELEQLEPIAGTRAFALDELTDFLGRAIHDARLAAVVASQGHYDETALERLLSVPASYVGVLASRKRMDALRGVLTQAGVEPERLERVRSPIGLDINARLPAEIALAILAEIVALGLPQLSTPVPVLAETESVATIALDPVCGMEVAADEGALTVEHAGVTYYFCCDRCARRFSAEPERFTVALERA